MTADRFGILTVGKNASEGWLEQFLVDGVKAFAKPWRKSMKECVIAVAFAAIALTLSTPIANAEGEAGGSRAFLKALPADSLLVSNVYGQPVYDTDEKKIGKIEDLLLDRGGKAQAAIISVGGFLGIGDKEVAAPFEAVRIIEKGNKSWLEIDATKDALKSAPAVTLDKVKGIWTVKD